MGRASRILVEPVFNCCFLWTVCRLGRRFRVATVLQLALVCWCASQMDFVRAEESYETQRTAMVENVVKGEGVSDQRVLEAMSKTPRHEFVPEIVRKRSYFDTGLPIGHGQTISSPYIVARMTEQLEPRVTDRVLEIGTGSGYQAAVLSPLVKDVYSIEIVPELGERAKKLLKRLGYDNVHVRVGDGYKGWPDAAPFDKIIVTCSPENVPQPLVDQLVDGGHLVVPVGERFQQQLFRFTKVGNELKRERVEATFFVPMTGQAEQQRVKPDPVRPELLNGGFEEQTKDGKPVGWFYVRNGTVTRDPKSHEQLHCMCFQKEGDAPARALQPIGIDGTKKRRLEVEFWSRGDGIQGSILALQSSQMLVEFYDEDRVVCGDEVVGVPNGSYPWRRFAVELEVPKAAKLAMVHIGLLGGRGKICFDEVRVR